MMIRIITTAVLLCCVSTVHAGVLRYQHHEESFEIQDEFFSSDFALKNGLLTGIEFPEYKAWSGDQVVALYTIDVEGRLSLPVVNFLGDASEYDDELERNPNGVDTAVINEPTTVLLLTLLPVLIAVWKMKQLHT